MKVILRQDYDPLGHIGEVVTVKDGYARNFLIPRKIAILATPKNMKILDEEQKLVEQRQNKDKRVAEAVAQELLSLKKQQLIILQEHLAYGI